MFRKFLFVAFVLSMVSSIMAEDFSLSGLSLSYPSDKFFVDNRTIGVSTTFNLNNKYATEPDFAMAHFNYGNNNFWGRYGDMHKFCKRRMKRLCTYMQEGKNCSNFVEQSTYIEDYATYSIAVTGFTQSVSGTPLSGIMIIVASSQYLLISIFQGTKEEYVADLAQVISTIRISQIPELQMVKFYPNYYAFLNKPMPISSLMTHCLESLRKSDTGLKPLIEFVPKSLEFVDINNNQVIDANESCKIRFQITNKGKGQADGCVAKIIGTGSTSGLVYNNVKLPSIAVGTSQIIEIPIEADINTANGTATFTIEVYEPNGFGIDPMSLTVNTRAFDAPMLKVVDYAVSGNGTIQKKQPFDLQLLLQNTKYGKAEDVDVSISLPAGVTLWEGQEKIHYNTFDGGEKKNLNYQIAISGNYAGATVPINISIKEKYGKFAENKTINLALNQQLASATSVVLQGEAQQVQREAIQIGALGSVVDRNIPVSSTVNKNTFAVIIANEKYMSVASVPFALNDGMKFREYCVKTLGVPEKNIHYIANATGNQIKAQVQWLQNVTKAYEQEDPNIIFYYAGHGIPDESSKTAYLLPVDGIGTDVTTGYKLDNLYSALGQMPSVHTTIFLDACFSGSKREDGMLASARGIAIKAKSGVPQGNMVVFSAAQGDETAYPNKEEGHGMFTYYLLKKLQDTKGDVTLQDLGNYITRNVSQQSILINGKSQTPSVTAAAVLGDSWQSWKLK